MMKEFLVLFFTVSTLFAQRTPLKINGTVVDNPNFTNNASLTWSRSGANVSAALGTDVTISNKVTIGTGSVVTNYFVTVPQLLQVSKGTGSSPDTSTNTVVKVSRIMELPAAIFGSSDGSDAAAAISAVNIGTVLNEVQPIGVQGMAINYSTVGSPTGADDACGVYGVGRAIGTGFGIGAFLGGRREATTAHAHGAEIVAGNYTSTALTYNPAGTSQSGAIAIAAVGLTNSDAGIQFNNPFGPQYDVGISFGNQVAGGQTGPVTRATIVDDGSATDSLLIRGTHSGNAIAVNADSGAVRIGRTNAIFSSSLLEVYNNGNKDPIATFSGSASTDSMTVRLRNGAQESRWFVSGGTDSFLTGTVQGDTGYIYTTNTSFILGGAGATKAFEVKATGSGGTITVNPGSDSTLLKGTGYAVTGSGTTSGYQLTGTLNTSGLVDGFLQLKITNSAAGANTKALQILGGAAGATTIFNVALANGSVSIPTAAAGMTWGGRLFLNDPASGRLKVADGSAVATNTAIVFGLHASPAAAKTLASANTIAPLDPITFVDGSTTVKTITAPSHISGTGGFLCIIPATGSTWVTDTTGNIALATTAVPLKAIYFAYDATTTKWYPSY